MEWKRILMENKFAFSIPILWVIMIIYLWKNVPYSGVYAGKATVSLILALIFDQFISKKRNPIRYIKEIIKPNTIHSKQL